MALPMSWLDWYRAAAGAGNTFRLPARPALPDSVAALPWFFPSAGTYPHPPLR
jgi:hypothetical protein